jgi:hypothetical protein
VIDPPLEPKAPGHVAACHFPLESWPLADLRRHAEQTTST